MRFLKVFALRIYFHGTAYPSTLTAARLEAES
jgi:hypothetical protein